MAAFRLAVFIVCVSFRLYQAHGSALETMSVDSCSYTFHVPHDEGCSVNDGVISQLQTTVNELQKQVTALVQQNAQIVQDNSHLRQQTEHNRGPPDTVGASETENHSIGATYTRWGRTECRGNASLVYSGYTAGSWYATAGGMVDLLCLPSDPQWGRYVDGFQSMSYIFGAEYKTTGYSTSNVPFLRTNANVQHFQDHDVPCAVCYTYGKNSAEMFPAMTRCPENWSQEYKGYLMATHETFQRMKAVCVDEAPEVTESGAPDQNGAVLSNVEVQCGSLPCPHYVSGRELTCSVCSR